MGGAKRILLVATVLLTLQGGLRAQSRIEWVGSWAEARALAAQQQRLVLIHFWSPTCVDCLKLEHSVYSQPDCIQAVATNYVAWKVDAAANPAIAREARVQRWPTDVIVTSAGKELYRGPSSLDPLRYVATLDQVAAQARVGVSAGAAPGATGPAPMATAQSVARPMAAVPPSPAHTTNQWVAPQSTGAAPPTAEQHASFTRPYGGDFQLPPTGSVAGVSMVDAPSAPAAPAAAPISGPPPVNTANLGPPTFDMSTAPALPPSAAAGPTTAGSPGGTSSPPVTPAADGVPMGLDGYCPVTLVEQEKWVKGDKKWGVRHRGRLYLFLSPQAQQQFLDNFDKYAPALSGYDAVKYSEQGQLVEGRRAHGVFYRGQIYLFADEAALQQFWTAPDHYTAVVREEQQRSAMRSGVQR